MAVTFASLFPTSVRGLVLIDASPPGWDTAICAVPDDGTKAAGDLNRSCDAVADPSRNPEHLDGPAAFAGVAAISSLGSLPVTVLTASEHPFPGLAAAEEARLNEVWDAGQDHWASLSSASRARFESTRQATTSNSTSPPPSSNRSVGCSRDHHGSHHERHHHETPSPDRHDRRRRSRGSSVCCTRPATTSPLPATHDVQRIVDDRVEGGRSTGIVAGVVLPDGTTQVAGAGADGGRPLDGDSVFEIGSITKTFTATLLALMVQDHDVDLDDPVASLLPASVSVPMRYGRQITLADLATHTSGLPRNPANLDPRDPENPYADYTVAQLYDFLAVYELATDPGAHFEYSNFGVALLGHALGVHAGMPFEDLVRTRILEPLRMTSTGITLDAATAIRFVDGHDARGKVTAHFDMPVLAGEGGLRSSVNDMLKFAAANLDPKRSELHKAMASAQSSRSHRRRRPTDCARLERRRAQRQHDHLVESTPRRIECFDISNLQGSDIVASMVVWEDGRMKKSDYRRFIIRSVSGAPDDFQSMREVVTRRYKRVQEEGARMPGLVLIDGGIGQLHAAQSALDALNIVDQQLASIAKREEILYVAGREDEPVILDPRSPVLKVIQQIRDESHRFAITFHRARRAKRHLTSELSEIAGVGPRTRQRLLTHFGSLERIRSASVEQLAEVANRPQSEAVWKHFHGG